MFRYSLAAWAILAYAWMGGALAAQQMLVPDGAGPVAHSAPAAAGKPKPKPPRPTDLHAKAISTTETRLTWSDNSTNEYEFRLEIRYLDRAWEEMGALAPNVTSVLVFALEPGEIYFFRVRAKNGGGLSTYSNEAAVTAFLPPEVLAPCQPGPSVLCLRNGRYRVEAAYAGGGQAGAARAVAMSDEAGYFWFFTQGNVEVLIKMLDGCALNGRRWVFTTGLTNLRVTLLVVDTQTGATSTYLSEANRPFPPIQDTDAFAECR